MSNLGKYESTNPLKQAMLRRFLRRVDTLVGTRNHSTILDVGVGEGLFWRNPHHSLIVGVDLRLDALCNARERGIHPVAASATSLPVASDAFDLVVAIEILEHLIEPGPAIAELARATRDRAIVTVPWEPWFSLMVLVGTASNVRRLGREPEHVQAFGPKELQAALQEHFVEVEIRTCLPWLIAEVAHEPVSPPPPPHGAPVSAH